MADKALVCGMEFPTAMVTLDLLHRQTHIHTHVNEGKCKYISITKSCYRFEGFLLVRPWALPRPYVVIRLEP